MKVHDGTNKQSHHVISIILYINTTCWLMMELKTKSSCYINHLIYQYYMQVHDGTKKTKSSCYINHFKYQYYMLVHDGTKNKVIVLYQSFYISILHAGS